MTMPHLPSLPLPVIACVPTMGLALVMVGICTSPAQAQQNDAKTGVVYTCVDTTGRTLTSDRPIANCMDRDQRVLSSQGTLLEVIRPALTAAQRAAQQGKDRQERLALQRQHDQERFDEVLLIRYPTRAAHETGRRDALTQLQWLLNDAKQQLTALENNRQELSSQIAPYQKNSDNIPAKLNHNVASNTQDIKAQQRLVAGYQAEVDRINAQYDAEDKRLQPAWKKMELATDPATATP